MEIRRTTSTPGPAELFTGEVTMETIAPAQGPTASSLALVHFSAGAHTAWHTHEHGQTLHVHEGEGRIQSRGGEVRRLREGDVVIAPGGEWHWHGAAPDTAMTHLTLAEGTTTWGEHVSDDDYLVDPAD